MITGHARHEVTPATSTPRHSTFTYSPSQKDRRIPWLQNCENWDLDERCGESMLHMGESTRSCHDSAAATLWNRTRNPSIFPPRTVPK
ncbi:hypothetical protein Y032_0051g2153 [Ancylostoma ceylanicum]|uniref:Uncharacterized protein n=1 Tax=Ancylostoma ceylanicum TaxID=53326 RepID=A0A016U900_9BILA|nr:hypothetical protein Y032_0051g2153 [Ancylostoma ceylanicum]